MFEIKSNQTVALKQIQAPTNLSTFHLLCYYVTDYSPLLHNTSKWRDSLWMQTNAKLMLGFGLKLIFSIYLTQWT